MYNKFALYIYVYVFNKKKPCRFNSTSKTSQYHRNYITSINRTTEGSVIPLKDLFILCCPFRFV